MCARSELLLRKPGLSVEPCAALVGEWRESCEHGRYEEPCASDRSAVRCEPSAAGPLAAAREEGDVAAVGGLAIIATGHVDQVRSV